ncbi:hypothetical protein [Pontibacter rugosus]
MNNILRQRILAREKSAAQLAAERAQAQGLIPISGPLNLRRIRK